MMKRRMIRLGVVVWKRLFFSFVYKVKRHFLLPVKPLFINFSATYECNGRCRMCDNWQRYRRDPQKIKEELSLKDLENFFKENRPWLANLEHIGIAGGEPFLRPDLVGLIALIRKQLPRVKIGLQTNGLAPKIIAEKLEKIKRIYPQITLAVSLDGIGKTHDKIRGIKGAFQKVLQTIKVARKLGVKEITSGMTITKDNYQEILKVREFLRGQRVEFSCFLADEGEYYSNIGRPVALNKEEKKVIAEQLREFSCDYYLDNLRRMILNETKRHLPCYSGWTSLVIDPYGEVRPCVLRSESFGNIRNQLLREILSGKKAEEIRKKIKKCSCWSICEVTTSAVVDLWDIAKWLLFCHDKRGFLIKQAVKLSL